MEQNAVLNAATNFPVFIEFKRRTQQGDPLILLSADSGSYTMRSRRPTTASTTTTIKPFTTATTATTAIRVNQNDLVAQRVVPIDKIVISNVLLKLSYNDSGESVGGRHPLLPSFGRPHYENRRGGIDAVNVLPEEEEEDDDNGDEDNDDAYEDKDDYDVGQESSGED